MIQNQSTITICHDFDSPNFQFLKKQLEDKNYLILNNDILDIDNNRQINVQAYYQLKNKSANNPYVYFLHSKMIETKIEEIENAEIVLLYNHNPEKISPLMFFYITIAWYTVKKIYTWKPISKKTPFQNELISLNIPSINENIENIVPPRKDGIYSETQQIIIIDDNKELESSSQPIKKKLIKKTIS